MERAQFKLNLDGKVIQAGKFDQKSTNEEREAMLRAIFEGEQEKNDEEAVYGDEELNEIISRSDSERVLFSKLDSELESKSKGKSRLIEDAELPAVYLEQPVDEDETGGTATPDSFVRTARRKEVSYNESMSDERWLSNLEKTEDEASEESASKKRKTAKVVGAGPTLKLTVPRRPSVITLPTSIASTNTYEVKPDGLDETTRTRIINQVIDALDGAVDSNGGHRYLLDIFQELPPKQLYPDYYQLIRSPISMDQIRERAPTYPSVHALLADLDLIWSNAQQYNIEGSQVYEDATVLRQLVRDRVEELMESVGRFDGDNAGSSDLEDGDDDQDDEDDEEMHQEDHGVSEHDDY